MLKLVDIKVDFLFLVVGNILVIIALILLIVHDRALTVAIISTALF